MHGKRSIAVVFMLIASASLATAAPTLSSDVSDDYGAYVTGPDGRPVYAFVTSARGGDDLVPLESCDTPCRRRWPPVFVEGEITVGDGLSPDLVGTAEDPEGTVASYASEPLFTFHDNEPGGDPQGQGIHSFGGWWYLLTPEGKHIDTGITPEITETPNIKK